MSRKPILGVYFIIGGFFFSIYGENEDPQEYAIFEIVDGCRLYGNQ